MAHLGVLVRDWLVCAFVAVARQQVHHVWLVFYSDHAHSWPGRNGGKDWHSTVAREGVAQVALGSHESVAQMVLGSCLGPTFSLSPQAITLGNKPLII